MATNKTPPELTQKVVVSCQGQPVELGERLHWEAMRKGLGRAPDLGVSGGASRTWHLVEGHPRGTHQGLNFYHASHHLHAPSEVVQRQCHDLRHGQERRVLRRMTRLRGRRRADAEIIQCEQHYFTSHAHRMNYQEIAQRGWPIGSGAVESACAQKPRRFKRPGQFWTTCGLRHLDALIQAREHDYWEQFWCWISSSFSSPSRWQALGW